MVDAARKLLDDLMGKKRNEGQIERFDWWEKRVCKPYLLGCCLNVLLTTTKYDMGPCRNEICGNERSDNIVCVMKMAVTPKSQNPGGRRSTCRQRLTNRPQQGNSFFACCGKEHQAHRASLYCFQGQN